MQNDVVTLFDLDGTLLNTNRLILNSFKYTFKKELNLEIEDEQLYPYFGEPLINTLQRFDKERGVVIKNLPTI